MELDQPICPSGNPDFCNIELMTLNLSLSFQLDSNSSCCHSCTCYGDPHCIGFNGKNDTWVVCDARVIKPNTGMQQCTMNKAMCLKQIDNTGNPCQWQNAVKGKKWKLGIQGSQCIPSNNKLPPQMLMYSADNFRAELYMGERAIITSMQIVDTGSGNGYFLSAQNCYDDVGGQPWRDSFAGTTAPTSPSWAPNDPYKFSYTVIDNGEAYGAGANVFDVLWEVANLPSSIGLSIRCTRTATVVNGQIEFSAPRLNIDQLREPLNYLTQRTNVGGFCPNGTIAKEGTTSNTDMLEKLGACEPQSQDLDIAKVICSAGTSQAGVVGCQLDWCKATTLDFTSCAADIKQYGWDQTYCAVHTVLSQRAADCTAAKSQICAQCLSTIEEFGFTYANEIFQDVHPASVTCTPQSALPSSLQDCQPGVNVQYWNGGAWVNYLGVPSTITLCGGKVSFDSVQNPELFANRVRLSQCSLDVACLSDECATTFGWSAFLLGVMCVELTTASQAAAFLYEFKASPPMCPCTKSPVGSG